MSAKIDRALREESESNPGKEAAQLIAAQRPGQHISPIGGKNAASQDEKIIGQHLAQNGGEGHGQGRIDRRKSGKDQVPAFGVEYVGLKQGGYA